MLIPKLIASNCNIKLDYFNLSSMSLVTDYFDAKENLILMVINTVLKTDYKNDDITKEIVKDFVLIDQLHLNQTTIQYKGINIGLITNLEFPKNGLEFIPDSNFSTSLKSTS